jgi:hypothetical protein
VKTRLNEEIKQDRKAHRALDFRNKGFISYTNRLGPINDAIKTMVSDPYYIYQRPDGSEIKNDVTHPS